MTEVWEQNKKEKKKIVDWVYYCPECGKDITYLSAWAEIAVEYEGTYHLDEEATEWSSSYMNESRDDVAEYACPHCGTIIDDLEDIVSKEVEREK